MPLLIGPLAHPLLRQRLAPEAAPAAPLAGHALVPEPSAGIAAGCWPRLRPAGADLPLWQAEWTPALRRYAAILKLEPCQVGGREVLGAVLGGPGPQGQADWQPELAAAMADQLLALPQDQPAEQVRRRLPMIASWVASRLRAIETAALPGVGPAGQGRWDMLSISEPYAAYFSVEEARLRHLRHGGGWTPDLLRAVFVSGDATVVLPWDPRRDRVMLIDQFRAGPALRGDAQPWLHETVAGRVDALETPAEAALREAVEEAGLRIERLIPGPHNYPSPGAVAEYLYLYIGIADLPDEAAGIGGLDSEDEDIRSHLIPRAELTRMALAGEIRNGPLLNLALWLELRHEALRRDV
ncbi:NUDIX domain-containing protein [Paracoccus sp. N5]|uniref:NUDIX domain-containing protein n=1 Tax=Paracoccus sp. N5 TaxID=1101189 RepID=UPI000362F332|nr:NUDIX domain-containing protein [Paracoccus sp. N5]